MKGRREITPIPFKGNMSGRKSSRLSRKSNLFSKSKNKRMGNRSKPIVIPDTSNQEIIEVVSVDKACNKSKENMRAKSKSIFVDREREKKYKHSKSSCKIVGRACVTKKQKKKKASCKESRVYGKIHVRTSPRPLCETIKRLTVPQLECISEMGFKLLMHFNIDGIPTRLGYFVVDAFDPEEMVLNLSIGKLCVTKERIHEILGLPKSGKKIEEDSDDECDGYIEDWQDTYGLKKVTATDIAEHIYKSHSVDLQFQLDFIMLFVATMVNCTKSGSCKLGILRCLSKDTRFRDYDWCGYIYKMLKECKNNWSAGLSPNTFTGPLTLLTLIYLDGTAIPTMKRSNILSPIKSWSLFIMQIREAMEVEGGGFGKGEVFIVDEEDEAATEEEYKDVLDTMLCKLVGYKSMFSNTLDSAKEDYPNCERWRELDLIFKGLFTHEDENTKKSQKSKDGNDAESPQEIQNITKELEYMEIQEEVCTPNNSPAENSETDSLEDIWSDPGFFEHADKLVKMVQESSKKQSLINESDAPSFSLGLTQLFNEPETDNVMDELDNIPLSERFKQVADKTPVVRPKRMIRKTKELQSPYINRVVDISSKPTTEEKKLWAYVMGACLNEEKVLFATTRGYNTDVKDFESLETNGWVMSNIIDCWSMLLNHEERSRSPESPHILFCPTTLVTADMLEDGKMTAEAKQVIIRRNIVEIIEQAEESVTLKNYNLVFFPVLEDNHYYLICFDIKSPSIVVVDNISESILKCELENGKRVPVVRKKGGSVLAVLKVLPETPIKYRELFGKYMQEVGHPRGDEILAANPIRLSLSWSTLHNDKDCGVFLMRHMETFKGLSRSWNCGLDKEGRSQNSQIRHLRAKYIAKLILSDINVHKLEVVQDAHQVWERYQAGKKERKREAEKKRKEVATKETTMGKKMKTKG